MMCVCDNVVFFPESIHCVKESVYRHIQRCLTKSEKTRHFNCMEWLVVVQRIVHIDY